MPKGSTARAIRSRSLTTHRDIDITGETSGVRLRFFDVKVNRETANHAVFEAGGSERRFHPSCQVKELFHTFLEKRIYVQGHSAPFRIIASASARSASHTSGKLEPDRLVEWRVARKIHALAGQLRLRAAQLRQQMPRRSRTEPHRVAAHTIGREILV